LWTTHEGDRDARFSGRCVSTTSTSGSRSPPTIEMHILDGNGAVVFFGETSTARMRRTIP